MLTSFDIMTEDLLTIHQDEFLKSAYKIMHKHSVRHLPVTNDHGHIIGLLSERDLKLAMNKCDNGVDEVAYQFDSDETVQDYMSTSLKVVSFDESISSIAKLMLKEKISSVLVMNHKKLISGIVTTDDLLSYLATMEEPQKESVNFLPIFMNA
jgi:CBS-domain-containing membrane protein